MATYKLPTSQGPNAYTQTVTLEGTAYDMEFHYNAREGRWALSIGTAGVMALMGVKVVESADLLHAFGYLKVQGTVPPGTIRVVDTLGLGRDPDLDTLGTEVIMLYDES